MKRTIMLAWASLAATPAFAQSSVTLYGIVDDGIVYVNHSAPRATAQGQKVFQMGSANESRWGLTGREDLGGGLRAIFTLENGFNINNGTMGSGGRLFGRQAYVGLDSTRFGQLTLGRQYDFGVLYVGPMASSKQWAGGYGAHVGDSDNFYNSFRLNNSVKYAMPAWHGLEAGAGYAFSNQASDGAGGGFANNRAYTFGARYGAGPFAVAASYLQLNHPVAGNTGGSNTGGAVAGDYSNIRNIFYGNVARQRVAAGGATYAFGPASAGFVYSWVGFDYNDSTASHLSNYEINAKYNITSALLVGAAFIYTDGHMGGGQSRGSFATGDDTNWKQVNLGLDYALSKRTELYTIAVWQRAGGDARQAAIFNSGGLSGSSSRDQILVAAGLRAKF
ncbi:porin [Caballeronia hypogeia]|uniref:Porin n=1 Tax=Caballeronia hypogeia TaxID=1777140 RepID=A0A157ZKK1_9BURK|nr:porin [Caballeronia hypogeia]SAK46043.1 porin [Caballeronia hypogeia]